MRIKTVKLKNFKFHIDLKFEIKNTNCLIYGENGSGKSSIYWAIYTLFKTYFRNSNFDFEKYKNNRSTQGLHIEIQLDDTILRLPAENYDLPDSIDSSNFKTIYFANQSLLNEITNDRNQNFYSIIVNYLKKYFSTLKDFAISYNHINDSLNSDNHIEKVKDKNIVDKNLKNFLEQLENKINEILTDSLQENFIVKFEFQEGLLNSTHSDLNFANPNIILKIDDEKDLKLHFNEAKLKLTSIAIFFALIKLEEDKSNKLKLLVLDDFLTSLDMANRHYIIEYIFRDFKKYQKIILTHNLQFYNFILDWLNTNNQKKQWDCKNIYLRTNGNNEESAIYDYTTDYIKEAKEKLENNELQTCGNLIRKEFERIVYELEKSYHLGKKEDSNTILELIINNKPIYKDQNLLFEDMIKKIKHCKNMSNNMEGNKERIKTSLDEINIEETAHNSHLKSILKNLLFYRKIIMNKSSHDNPNAENYRKEYKNSIVVIEKLNELIET